MTFWNASWEVENIFEKYFSENIFKNIFHKFWQPNFTSRFGTFCTESTVTYIYFSQEGNYDLLKCITKNISKNIFLKNIFRKIFSKIFFTRFRQPNFKIEIRDLLYQIYGNIYLFFTRGEARPFEMHHEKYFSKNIFRNIFWKYFSRFRQPFFNRDSGPFVPNLR